MKYTPHFQKLAADYTTPHNAVTWARPGSRKERKALEAGEKKIPLSKAETIVTQAIEKDHTRRLQRVNDKSQAERTVGYATLGAVLGGGLEVIDTISTEKAVAASKPPVPLNKKMITVAAGTAAGGLLGFLSHKALLRHEQDSEAQVSKAHKRYLGKYLKSRSERGLVPYTAENYKPIFG